jgi:hypothetical protein
MEPQTQNLMPLQRLAGGNGHEVVEFTRRYRLLDADLMSRLSGMTLGSARNCLTRLVNEKRVAVQKLTQNEPLYYRAKGTKAVGKDHVPHAMKVSKSMVGFTLGLRKYRNVDECSVVADTRLWQPWPIHKLAGITSEVIPDQLFTIIDPKPIDPSRQRMFLSLEEETGKIHDEKVQRARMLAYWQHRQVFCFDKPNEFGIKIYRVVYMAVDDWFAGELRRMAHDVLAKVTNKKTSFFLFSSHERWSLDAPLDLLFKPIWQTAFDDTPKTLME